MNCVVWDWNGTLFNDIDLCFYCINRLLYNNGYKGIKTLKEYKSIFGFPIEDYYKRAGFDFSKKPYTELAHEYMDIYLNMISTVPLNKDAKAVLEGFKNKGYHQYILSASKQEILNEQVNMHNIRHYFKEIYGMGNVYASSKTELAHRFLEMHPEYDNIIYIGDTDHDLQVSLILHAKAYLYSNGHQKLIEDASYTLINNLTEVL